MAADQIEQYLKTLQEMGKLHQDSWDALVLSGMLKNGARNILHNEMHRDFSISTINGENLEKILALTLQKIKHGLYVEREEQLDIFFENIIPAAEAWAKSVVEMHYDENKGGELLIDEAIATGFTINMTTNDLVNNAISDKPEPFWKHISVTAQEGTTDDILHYEAKREMLINLYEKLKKIGRNNGLELG